MKILILGAKGMLGCELVEVFKDFEIYGWDKKELAMEVNGKAVGYLASICQKIGAIFIHYSTDYVFGGDNPEGYKEGDTPRNPLNVYGQSKLLGEKLLLKRKHWNSELQFAIKSELMFYLIRTSWLFGKHGKNFVDTMLKLARNQDELKKELLLGMVLPDKYLKLKI